MADSINVVCEGVAWLQKLAPTEEGPEMWDVEIRHDSGVTLRAHKLLLAKHSAFFREAFSDQNHVLLREKETGVGLGTLKAVLNSIYRIPFKVDAQNVWEVLATANHLQVEQICECCCAFLKARLSVANALSTWLETHDRRAFRGSIDLQEACAGFIYANFKELSTRGEEFTALKPEDLAALLSHRPAARKESLVVDAVIAWLNKTWAGNFNAAPGVIAEINWNDLRESELTKMKSVNEFAKMKCSSSEEKEIKLEIMELLFAPPRSGKDEKSSKIVAIRQQHLLDLKMSLYDLAAGEWTSRLSELSLPVGVGDYVQMAFAFLGSVVLVSGPTELTDGGNVKAHVLKRGRIHASIPFSIPEDCLGSVYKVTFSGGPFFCLTCYNGQFRASQIILFDFRHLLPAHEEVAEIPALPVHETIEVTDEAQAARGATGSKAVYFDDEVYLMGAKEVSVFSLSRKVWRRGPSTHHSCCYEAHRFVVGGVLYSVGGDRFRGECSKIFELFDPLSGAEGWVKGPDLVHGCWLRAHYVRDGRLFVVGETEVNLAEGDDDPACYYDTTVVQSIDMADFSAGWRDDSVFFEDLDPAYAFAV